MQGSFSLSESIALIERLAPDDHVLRLQRELRELVHIYFERATARLVVDEFLVVSTPSLPC